MPDDPLFDDDNRLPDWMFGSDDEAEVSRPSDGPGTPSPWQSHPGGQPSAGTSPASAPPWRQYPDSTPSSQGEPSAAAPWQSHPGGTPPPPPGGAAPLGAPSPGPADHWDEFDWTAPTTDKAIPTESASDLPRGLTGMLPWRQMDQSPEAAQPPSRSDQEADWLSAFGEAAASTGGMLPADDEGDLDWLAGDILADRLTGQPAAPSGSLLDDPLDEWPEDDALFAAIGHASDQPPTEAPAEGEASFDDLLWPDDDAFADLGEEPSREAPPAETPASSSGIIRRLAPQAAPDPSSEPEPVIPEPQDAGFDWDAGGPAEAFDFDSAPFGGAPDESRDDSADEDEFAGPGFTFDDDQFAAALIPPDEAQPDEAQPDEGAAAPQPTSALPDWLTGEAKPPTSPSGRAGEVGAAPDETPFEEVSEEQAEPLPDWIDGGESFDARYSGGDLTYDEWEEQELERERLAAIPEAERVLDEVPDWFAKIEEQPPTPPDDAAETAPAGPEFVPDWFTGLDEQDMQAAPDWFQKLDFSTDPLAAPTESPLPPAPEPGDSAVPDWFKADGMAGAGLPESSEMDWAGLFGGSPPDAQASMPAPSGETSPPESVPSGTRAPFADDDLPLPDAADFLDRLGSARDEPDDWMSGFAPSEAPVPAPGSVRTPDEPPEDFVERFEPFEPGPPASPPTEADFLGEQSFESELDWLQEISAADLQGYDEEQPVFEPPVPQAAEPEPAEASLLPDAMHSSQDIDSLLGLSESALIRVTPADEGVSPFGSPDDESFDWSEVDAWPDLSAAESAEMGPDAALVAAGETGEPERAAPEKAEAGSATPHAADRPAWLEEMRPADLPVELVSGGARLAMRQRSLEELPEGLRSLHARAGIEPPAPPPAPASGPLAGIEGVLPVLSEALPPIQRESMVEGLVITREEQARVERLQALLDLLAAEEEELDEGDEFSFAESSPFDLDADEEMGAVVRHDDAARAPRPRRPRSFKLDRLVIMLALFAALLVPFITDSAHFAADPPPLGDDQMAVAGAVEALQPGARVLVALEYGPTAAGELDPLAEAVVRDLLARQAVPIMISTNPVAALHAQAILGPLADDELLLAARAGGESALIAGEDYVLLAYLPGQAVGVRTLARTPDADDTGVHPAFDTDLWGDDSGLTVSNVATDIALIVVVGEDSTAVRTWAEQLESLPVPKVALVTAAVESLTGPYVNPDGYVGYLAGVRDTYSYNAARHATTRAAYTVPEGLSFEVPNPELSRWHSMALGAAAAAGVITLGMVLNLGRSLIRRRRR